jgi:hypothetical protein
MNFEVFGIVNFGIEDGQETGLDTFLNSGPKLSWTSYFLG